MLVLLGIPYLTGCLAAALDARLKEEAYRVYVTDCLYYVAEAWGTRMKCRYYEILHPQPEDKRTGKEIALDRLDRFGIKVVD